MPTDIEQCITDSNNCLREVCETADALFIDNDTSFYTIKGDIKTSWYLDPLHPNKKGSSALAVNIKRSYSMRPGLKASDGKPAENHERGYRRPPSTFVHNPKHPPMFGHPNAVHPSALSSHNPRHPPTFNNSNFPSLLRNNTPDQRGYRQDRQSSGGLRQTSQLGASPSSSTDGRSSPQVNGQSATPTRIIDCRSPPRANGQNAPPSDQPLNAFIQQQNGHQPVSSPFLRQLSPCTTNVPLSDNDRALLLSILSRCLLAP